MKKYIIIFIVLSFVIELRSQFYTSQLYNNHSEKLSKRNEWLFQQRLFPYADNKSINAAYSQRDALRNRGLTDNTSVWKSVGPSPAQFSFNPATSRVRVIAYDPDIAGTIYIGTSNGGVWKTTDSGRNWFPKTDFEASLSSGALAVYNDWSTNPPQRIVYYGTGEGGFGFVYSYYGRGLLKSTDGGDTWKQITKGLPEATYFYKIAVNPASPNVLLAALGSNYANPVNTGGLYRSEDFGESWQRVVPISTAEDGLNCNDVIFTPDGSKAYILGPFTSGSPNWWENGTGYRMSNDGGRTFTQMATNLPGTGYFAINPQSPAILYALTAVDCNMSQLYRSADAGNTWAVINSNFLSNQCGYNMAVEMNPAAPDNIFIGTIELYHSTDRGNTFPRAFIPYHSDIHDIAFNPHNPNEMMVANDGGVAMSTNGGSTFINLNNTLSTLECYSVSVNPNDPDLMLAGTQDNGVQENFELLPNTYSWRGLTGYDATNVIINPENPNNYIAQLSSSPVGIHATTNKGVTWFVGSGLPGTYDYAWVRPIIKHPASPSTFLTASGSKVYITDDAGFNWREINNDDIIDKIQRLAVSFSDPNIIYAATGPYEYMPDAYQHNLYKSVDGGSRWTIVNTSAKFANQSVTLPNRYYSSIQIDKDDPNDVIVTFAGFGTNHIYRTYDGGTNWDIMDCDGSRCLPDAPVNDLLIRYNPVNNLREYYAATDVGVYETSSENIWHELSEGLPNCVVMDLELSGDKLKAATFGRGIYEWDLSGASMVKKTSSDATKHINVTNYPNPFNPVTEISFKLFSATMVRLTIYDITGKEITVLVNSMLEPSVYKFKWNAESYASGIYFYRLETNGHIQTNKMLLVK